MTHQEILNKLDLLLEKEYQLALTSYQVALEHHVLLQRVYQLDQADRLIAKCYLRLAQAAKKNFPSEMLEAHFKPKADKLRQKITEARKKALKTLDKTALKKLFQENFKGDKKLFEPLTLLFLPDQKIRDSFLTAFEQQDQDGFQTLLKNL